MPVQKQPINCANSTYPTGKKWSADSWSLGSSRTQTFASPRRQSAKPFLSGLRTETVMRSSNEGVDSDRQCLPAAKYCPGTIRLHPVLHHFPIIQGLVKFEHRNLSRIRANNQVVPIGTCAETHTAKPNYKPRSTSRPTMGGRTHLRAERPGWTSPVQTRALRKWCIDDHARQDEATR
jgi:hypothetical protein